jgi:cytochrome c oxidase assembly protein subunit 15
MPKTQNRAVMIWLFFFAGVVAFLVIFGGYTRLTRSGLSITEWNPVHGSLPPLSEQAWQDEFAKYQQTPEYIKVNSSMTLEGYKEIFWVEWWHRLIARMAGLFYAIPVFYFLFKGIIPRKEFGIYVVMGLLFIGQAVMGWLMVASGLVDRPAVSHFRLTLHLLLALSLLGLSLWVALGHRFGFQGNSQKARWSPLSKIALAGFVLLLIQISYGGMTAGLKAGHVSNTWPLMFGKLIPGGLFSAPLNIIEAPQTIVFIHRWFAFIALFAAIWVYFEAKKRGVAADITNGLLALIAIGVIQITFGVFVVLLNVKIELALLHQFTAILAYALAIYFIHRFRALDYAHPK